ncbi:hypothetical protein GGI19_003790 [Coemansia pectinata]|uniref:Fungal-type protein kinase domain-containing protein n=1 Tax=Coemansia pectinata TaxID=1052879 RepID=A0A9W8L905_9FUNG|nr:hypothetical protein GGI19_003790 [Coemansia pectinata]
MDPARTAPQVGTIGSLGQLFTSAPFTAAKRKERKEQTERTVRELLIVNCAAVWLYSHPPANRHDAATELTDRIARAFATDITDRVGTGRGPQPGRAQQFATWSRNADRGNADEKDAYSPLQDFFLYCARQLKDEVDPNNNRRRYRHDVQRVEVPGGAPRLILPFNKSDKKLAGSDDNIRPDVALCLRDINIRVERQANPHYCDTVIVVECKENQTQFVKAVAQLGRYILHVLRNQCDNRSPIGMVVCRSTAYVVVFGNDAVWVSTGANLATDDGRQTLIAQVVHWTLCSIDRLGLDTTVTRFDPLQVAAQLALHAAAAQPVPPAAAAQPVPPPRITYGFTIGGRQFFSRECQQVVDTIAGKRQRRILLWETIATAGLPTYMLIDYWPLPNQDEAAVIARIHAILGNNANVQNSYPHIDVVEHVQQQHEEGNLVNDDTITAYGVLSELAHNMAGEGGRIRDTHHREHLRILIQFPGNSVSECENEESAVVAIARAMAVHNAIYTNVGILHRNVSADNILHHMAVGGLQCVLMGFGNIIEATPDNPQPDRPDMTAAMALMSIQTLENPEADRTPLDDYEPLLCLVCWLGTFGVNQQQRMAYVADPELPILGWNKGTAVHIARRKREHLTSSESFRENILYNMRQGLLRRLAADIHRALFLHPDCHGSIRITDEYVEEMEDGRTKAALREIPSINGRRDPLALHYIPTTMNDIVANFQLAVARYRDVAPAVQGAAAANIAGGAEEGIGA